MAGAGAGRPGNGQSYKVHVKPRAWRAVNSVRRLVLESTLDDWTSDYEMQGDFQSLLHVEPPEAYRHMVNLSIDWIGRGILVPGDMVDGFQPWAGAIAELAARFAERSRGRNALAHPGEICWFDTGPGAPAEALRLGIQWDDGI